MRWVVWVALLVVIPGCAVSRRAPAPLAARPGAVQEGTASWYGPGFHGNRTSSGEVYNQYELTAAHQTIPLGTRVAVTNLDNNRTVEVRINDRGPFVDGRAIDLSYAAARTLGAIGPGTIPVRIQVLGDSSAARIAGYAVQVGAFADRGNAERLRTSLVGRFDDVYISPLESGSMHYYRVRLGRFTERDQATAHAHRIAALGLPTVIVEDSGRP